MTNLERVAYIRGLMAGLELDADKNEVRVINAIVELLEDMALSIEDLEEGYNEMADLLETVDDDLASLEDDFYGDEDDCGCDCGCCDDDDDECYYEVTCPTCGETICLSEDLISEGQMDCPNCGENLEFDLDDVEDVCDCGCGHDHDHE